MHEFIISSKKSFFIDPETGSRCLGYFLYKSVPAYFHDRYYAGDSVRRNTEGTVENIICTLKNQFGGASADDLKQALKNLIFFLEKDFSELVVKYGNLTVCIVPRAKVESSYCSEQLLFKKFVCIISEKIGLGDGSDYIRRMRNTRTTHMDRSGWGGDGELPYPGITEDTCEIADEVKGKNILLVDDLYTRDCNIDEDAIQALFNKGANSVIFYSLGRTVK